MEVISRMRGGGKHKDRKGKGEKKQGHYFLEFIYFVTVGSFTADGGLL